MQYKLVRGAGIVASFFQPPATGPATARKTGRNAAMVIAAGILAGSAPVPFGSALLAQPYQEVSSSSYVNWEDYGQDACLARAARSLAAARSAFGLRDRRSAGSPGVIEAIDAGDTQAMIFCAADVATREARALVMIGVHTTRSGLDRSLRDFLQSCMTTPACSTQATAGMAGAPPAGAAPQPGQPAAGPARPGQAVSGAVPGRATAPPPAPSLPPTARMPVSAPPGTTATGGPRPGAAAPASVPPPGPAASPSLPWPRPDPALVTTRRPRPPSAAPAATSAAAPSAAISAVCRFEQGPLAGRVVDYSTFPGVTGAAIGSACADGAGSSGVVVAASAAAERATLQSGGGSAISAVCRFEQGPLAGTIVDYSTYPGVSGSAIGTACADGAGSSGVVVAPTAAAVPAAVPQPQADRFVDVARTRVSDDDGQGACAFPHSWRNDVTGIGSSIWTVDPAGVARESGLGSATGQATLAGNRLDIRWQAGGYSGVYSVLLGPGCSGSGQLNRGQEVFPVQFTSQGGGAVAAPAAAGAGVAALAQRFAASRAMLSADAFARLYADLSVLLAGYGRQIGWPDGMDGNAPPGDPGRGIADWQAHYRHATGGGAPGVAAFVAGRLGELGQRLSAASRAEMESQVAALLERSGA